MSTLYTQVPLMIGNDHKQSGFVQLAFRFTTTAELAARPPLGTLPPYSGWPQQQAGYVTAPGPAYYPPSGPMIAYAPPVAPPVYMAAPLPPPNVVYMPAAPGTTSVYYVPVGGYGHHHHPHHHHHHHFF
ncbi:hypothetical protein CEUSTIGMA_g9255.t1 [Chlamydomonas eustigma]|uniref:Uncharacterized protein n=1 Tax=Chlamydomonas eustigma TaxID=1157962 RepID=A0A250XFH8_9CHLO|nr:hypothetical protein CEUSTIGMA_g9255.t1 [Chlamydomonas eustigma]|eukprot:GAX81827.1 hypothetical protein CEUSTIGMA_g9255.t1 [Chlamydomonas eustigma]